MNKLLTKIGDKYVNEFQIIKAEQKLQYNKEMMEQNAADDKLLVKIKTTFTKFN